MKTITICQPYASAFFLAEHCRKRVENRDWPTPYRGPLLIHAGKSNKWMNSFNSQQEALMRKGGMFQGNAITLPFGAILGLVELVDCLTLANYLAKYGPDPWAFGPWCHVYAAPELLPKPIPYTGHLGIYNVPDDVLRIPKSAD